MITGGDLLGDIMGIAAGHIYYYLCDIVPVTFRKNFLFTPGFVRRYLDNPRLYEPTVNHNYVNNDQSNSFRNRFDNNNSNNANTNNTNSNNRGNNSGGGFQAFSGRGTTLG
jgi:hypothetical protein